MNNKNKKSMRVLLLGTGAVGSNLIWDLLPDLRGEHEVTILDRDVVEERNITAATQMFTTDQIELPKVQALQYNLYKFFNREVQILNIDVKEISGSYDLILDCLDNHDARQFTQNLFHTTNHIPLLHIGLSDKMTFEISWAENYSVPTDITSGVDLCSLQGVSSFIKMVSALASLVVQEYLDSGTKMEYIGNQTSIRRLS